MNGSEGISSCPVCNIPIDPDNLDWSCPVCGHFNENRSYYKVCERCRFGPRIIPCPKCKTEIEISELVGNHAGYYARSIVSPYMISDIGHYVYTLADLEPGLSRHVDKDDFIKLDREKLQSAFQTKFASPVELDRLLIIKIHDDGHGLSWLHCFAYAGKEWPEEREEAKAMISVYFSEYEPTIRIKLADVLISV